MRPKRIAAYSMLAALTLTAGACGGAPARAPVTATPPGEDAVISYNGTEPESPLVPGDTVEVGGIKVLGALFKGLVEYDPKTAVPRNAIAESIKTTDSKVYTITLKPGWTFQDGTPVTAKSFVDAWNFTAYGPNHQKGASLLSHIQGFGQVNSSADVSPAAAGPAPVKEMSGLRVVDDRTFVVTLNAPFAVFPSQLGSVQFFPLPASFYRDPAAFKAHPIGDGPFEFVSYKPGSNIVVRRYDKYAGEKPHIGGIEYRFYRNLDDAYADVVANKLDYLDFAPWTALVNDRYKSEVGDRSVSQPYIGMQGISFPVYDRRYADPRVRQAISMAIDRVGLIQKVFLGHRVPADGIVPPDMPGAASHQCGDLCTYQPQRAKELFDSTGFTGPVELASNVDSANEAWMRVACDYIAQSLARPCNFVSVPSLGEFRRQIDSHTMTMPFRSALVAEYPSIENFLNQAYRTGGSVNAGLYSNPAVDALLTRADAAPTEQDGWKLYQEAERIVLQDMPSTPIWFQSALSIWSSRMHNVQPTQFRELDLYSVTVS
ncbi:MULTISPECIES: ABC transporter substrate-binding protein [unclassified Nocardia]|uniref:peptide ABC transporter substrate-binding protein n=1 Tax=unclassified Nocardia TaxID=2637762 RepID=UPI001CE3FEE5|nr:MULTISPECIES: ABC transporter substrate-binding protein [unclassified Nocardia]